MNLTQDAIRDQIPYYLTQEAKENLIKALNSFPSIDYYINLYNNDVLQGDGWTSLELYNFESGEKKAVKGIILSNSCDISQGNKRAVPAKIIFAPIIRLRKYIEILEKSGLDQKAINGKISAIKNQHVTTMFYLPKNNELGDDFVALLDDVHTVPLNNFLEHLSREKVFTLSQAGFYLFLMKLSVHFCRFHENLDRTGVTAS